MKKRVISILLVICMVFTLVPMTVKAARALTELHIGSINVTLPDNGNTVYSNTDTSDSTWWVSNNSGSYTLTLKDSNISTSYIWTQSSLGNTAAIYANGDLNLVLQGTSTVHNPDAVTARIVKNAYGIYIYGNLNISGNGTLNVSSDTVESGACYGIYSINNMTISENVTINAIANDSVNAHTTYGIFCNGTVTIQNYASVSATGGEISGTSYDSRNSKGLALDHLIVKDDAKLNATGRSANAGHASSVGIELRSSLISMTISNNANVIAKGGSTGSNGSYGIYSSSDYSSGSLTVNGGNLTAISSSSTWVSAGIYMRGNININGGTVISSGGRGNNSSYGIYSHENNITINNSTVVATAGEITCNISNAIRVREGKSISIDLNSIVVAKATAVNASALSIDTSGIISGSYNGKIAVIGDSSLYKVLAGSLDLTTGDHSAKTLADDGYTWDNSTNTLTLRNIVVNGQADGIITDTFGIKTPAGTDIVLEGKNVVCAGDTTGLVSHGINTAEGSMTVSGSGEIIALGGHAGNYSYGLYSNTSTNLNGGSGISLTGHSNSISSALNLLPTTTDADAVHTLTAGGWTERVAVWYVTNPLDTPTAIFSATGTNTGTLSNVTTYMKYSVDGGSNWINITGTTMDITGVTALNDIKVFEPGNGTTTSDSSIQTINITQAFPPYVTSSACSTLANNDGKLIGVTTAMEYKPAAAAEWISGTGSDITGLSNGVHYVRIKAAGTALASNYQTISIAMYSGIPEVMPSATFVATGSSTGTLSNVTTNMRYSVDGGSSWGDISGVTMDITNVTDYNDIMIYQIGDGITTINSDPQIIPVTKASTPSVTSSNCTILANNDGKLIGITSAMEYKPAASAEWINGTGSDITGLSNDVYHVRVKAEGSVLASESQIIIIYGYFGVRESTPNAAFVATGSETGTLSNVTTNMKYSVDGGNNWINITGTTMDITGVTALNDVMVFEPGNGTTTTDSIIQTIDITQESVPSLTSSNCTTIANNDGKLIGVTATMEYRLSTATEWTSGTGSDITGLTNGIYYIRAKAAGTVLASSNQTISIAMYSAIPEATPNASFNATGTDTGTLSNVTTNMKYSVDGGNNWTSITGTTMDITGISALNDIMVFEPGNGTTTTDSIIQTINITQESIPSVTSSNCTTYANNDGKLIGVTSAMEYRPAASAEWISGTDSDITGLSNGVYHVRVKAEGSVLASGSQIIIIYEYAGLRENIPNATVDYINENLTGLDADAAYLINSGNVTSNANGEIAISNNLFNTTIFLVKVGNGITTSNSLPQTIILSARPIAPDCNVTQPSASSSTGIISGITAAMQYSTDNGATWINGDGNDVTSLSPGIVLVCVRAQAGTAPKGLNQSITITAYVPPVNPYTPPELVTVLHNGDSCIASNLDELILKRETLTVNADRFAKLIFDTDALKGIDEQTSGHVRFEIKDVSSDYQENYPGKQVFTLTVTSNGKEISSFGGSVTVSLPYELKDGETADQVTVWYLASDGIMTEIPCIYNVKTKLATFTVSHFSKYVVGVNNVWVNPYSDLDENSTYYEDIKFVTNNNLMKGVSLTEFSPDSILTRGMIATILYRIEKEPVTEKTLLFSDVADGMWYTNAVSWAADKNIVNGYDGKFHPDDTLTREQMTAILYRYATYKKYDVTKAKDLSSYTDKPSDWALTSVSWAVAEGLLTSNDGSLNLKGNITRGQIASVLKKFVENNAR
ncbi:MAG TPA: S-layer homology domain-containing protein [Clostridia bacterium]|nr:S-layer homology domain-containing protein [Clostridia bacterium]HQM96443.1 S-layer homology domain-containing protein [Clostridia bacterium]